MKKTKLVSHALFLVAPFAASGAFAQGSVTLYGIVDTGLAWQNSSTSVGSTANGHSAVKVSNGVWAGSRFGLKGSEDLGGGTKAVFQLEEGFNSATGAQAVSGLAFNRQAFVGLSDARYGTLTAGRQYTPYTLLLSPWSPTQWLTGAFGAHPGDIDSFDTTYRVNNALVYTSPQWHGFTVGGSYAFGGVPGSVNRGATWSAAVQYRNGPFGLGAGFQRVNNATEGGGAWGASSTLNNNGTQPSVSAINNGYQSAAAQQRFAVAGGWKFDAAWDLSVSYSNVHYIPGTGSIFSNEATFNTAGAVLHWKPVTVLDLAAGYSYTRATKSNGIRSAAQYQQFNLSQYYALSARTGLYAVQAYQRANGQTLSATGGVIAATASIGDGFSSTPSSARSQIAVGAGLIHRF
ncbi:MAG: porin [Burkholderia gladioli]